MEKLKQLLLQLYLLTKRASIKDVCTLVEGGGLAAMQIKMDRREGGGLAVGGHPFWCSLERSLFREERTFKVHFIIILLLYRLEKRQANKEKLMFA